MLGLTSWVWAGIRSPFRLAFMLLLVLVGALTLGRVVAPGQDFIQSVLRRDREESVEIRSKLKELQTILKDMEKPVCEKLNDFSRVVEQQTYLNDMRKQLEQLKDKDKGKEKASWDIILSSWDRKIESSSSSIKDYATVLVVSDCIDQALAKLRQLQSSSQVAKESNPHGGAISAALLTQEASKR
jgi:hypothetical protein